MRAIIVIITVGMALSGCNSTPTPEVETPRPTLSSPTPSASASREGELVLDSVIAENFRSPWGLAFVTDTQALVTERDTADIWLVAPNSKKKVGTVQGVRHGGEGGLLGIAFSHSSKDVFVYFTARNDNRVVRMIWNGTTLTQDQPIITGIPSGNTHNGGRLRFGPDDFLYVATGDAGERPLSQDLDSLAGKILRVDETGKAPNDNPFAGSPVWSYGHRNVQGLAFDNQGQLWASEFGQRTWDELNRIEAGKNYGWPIAEGTANSPEFIDPFAQWKTSENSPSGIAILNNRAYIAGLRGQRLWQVDLKTGSRQALFTDYGRLRTVEPAPDGSLWLLTSNTDGRGNPTDADDQLIRLVLR